MAGPGILGALFYGPSGRDDSYITFWAAERLAESGEILNYNGERLEQSSSLLHTLVLAALSAASPWSVPALAIAVGVAGGAAAVLGAFVLGRQMSSRCGWTAAALVATQPYLVYWAYGGLETTVAAALVLFSVAAAARWFADPAPSPRSAWAFMAAQALAVLVRPETGLVLVAAYAGVAGGAWLRGMPRREVRRPAAAATGVAATYVAVALGRLAYFGDYVPQTVRSKVGGVHLSQGLDFTEPWIRRPYVAVVVLVAAAACVVALRRPGPARLSAAMAAVASGGAVVTSGGDWMEAGRLLVPVLAMAAVLAALLVSRLPGRWPALAAAGLVMLQLGGVVDVARRDSTGLPAGTSLVGLVAELPRDTPWYEARNRVHARDALFLPHIVSAAREAIDRQGHVTIGSGQAGMVPYYLMGELGDAATFIDRGNLSTDRFGACEEGLVQTVLGNAMPLDYWAAHEAQCGVPLPDLIYDVGGFPEFLAGRYEAVHVQPAAVLRSSSSRLPGAPVSQQMFLAVKLADSEQ